MREKEVFILPMASVIETGNHIAHVPNGHARRTAARTFSALLTLVIDERAPWTLHQFEWGKDFLTRLLEGAGTHCDLVQHAVREFGAGDLCILAERDEYQKRARLKNVGIWTLDNQLASYG